MSLEQQILERLNQGIYLMIESDARWRSYPPHMKMLLKQLEPLHLIAVTRTFTYVDGLPIKTNGTLSATFKSAVTAAESIFGEMVKRYPIGFNCELRRHENNRFSIAFFQGPIWYLILCIPSNKAFRHFQRRTLSNTMFSPCSRLALQRFAYVPNSDYFLIPKISKDRKSIVGVAVVDGKPRVIIPISPAFFREPKPENVNRFGDLCFLTQSTKKWKVSKPISISIQSYSQVGQLKDPEEALARLLRECIGWKSFERYGTDEILLSRQNSLSLRYWRRILSALKHEMIN